MDYLALQRKSIAWHLVQDPKVLLVIFEQWQTYLEDGNPRNNVFWFVGCEWAADRIETALQLAKEFSPDIARFCDDVSHGRAPGFKEGIRHREYDEPEGSYEYWKSQIAEYVEFFTDSLEFNKVMRSMTEKQQATFIVPDEQNSSVPSQAIEELRSIFNENPNGKRNAMMTEFRRRMKLQSKTGIRQEQGLAILRKIADEQRGIADAPKP